MKELKQPVHGGRVWDAAEKLNINVEKIVDFSTNTNPLGPPKQLITTLMKNINTIAYYPDPDYRTLRMELARFYNINEENIIVGNGATELIHLFAQTFISENDRVIIPIPTFEEYQYAAQKVNARIVYIKSKNNMHINIDKIISKMNNTKVIFVCNPNNPTGILEKQKDILNLIEEANKKNVLVFLDESFMDLVVTKKPYTLIRSVNMFDNLFIIRSLTKIFSIPGLRIGFGVSSKYLIKEIDKYRIPWNVSTLAEKTISEALKYARQYLKTSRKIIERERNYMISELSKIDGIKVVSGDANFLFVDISETGLTSSELADRLIKHHILIRDCSTFTGLNSSYIRIAIKNHQENMLLISTLKEIVMRK